MMIHISVVTTILVAAVGAAPAVPVTPPSRHPNLFVVSFDGFRYDYFKRVPMPNLSKLRATGCSPKFMYNTFVTKTFGNHYSIATGTYQETHGIVDNSFYDPKYKRELHVSDGTDFWEYNDDIVPIWILNEMAGKGRYSGGMMWPGTYDVIERRLPTHYRTWDRNVTWHDRVDIAIGWMTNATHPANLVMFYIEEPDSLGHMYGPESEQVTNTIAALDELVGYLVRRLAEKSLFSETDIVFLSDHGMVEITQEKVINITQYISSFNYQQYGSSPILQFLPLTKSDEDGIYAALKAASEHSNFTVYLKDNLPERWHYKNNRRVQPIVALTDVGYAFQDFYNNINYWNKQRQIPASPNTTYGIHGYDNTLDAMHPFFVGHGPSFKGGHVTKPFSDVDVYPLMCSILGIAPAPNNGTVPADTLLPSKAIHAEWIVVGAMLLTMLIVVTIAIVVAGTVRRGRRANHEGVGYRQLNRRNGEEQGPKSEEEGQHLLVPSATEEV